MDHEPLGCLFRLIWLPYLAWKTITAQSVVGSSEMDRAAGRLWRNFAILGSVLLVVMVVVVIWMTLK